MKARIHVVSLISRWSVLHQSSYSVACSANMVCKAINGQGSPRFTHDNLIDSNIVRHKDNDIVQLMEYLAQYTESDTKVSGIHLLFITIAGPSAVYWRHTDKSGDRTIGKYLLTIKRKNGTRCILVLSPEFSGPASTEKPGLGNAHHGSLFEATAVYSFGKYFHRWIFGFEQGAW